MRNVLIEYKVAGRWVVKQISLNNSITAFKALSHLNGFRIIEYR